MYPQRPNHVAPSLSMFNVRNPLQTLSCNRQSHRNLRKIKNRRSTNSKPKYKDYHYNTNSDKNRNTDLLVINNTIKRCQNQIKNTFNAKYIHSVSHHRSTNRSFVHKPVHKKTITPSNMSYFNHNTHHVRSYFNFNEAQKENIEVLNRSRPHSSASSRSFAKSHSTCSILLQTTTIPYYDLKSKTVQKPKLIHHNFCAPSLVPKAPIRTHRSLSKSQSEVSIHGRHAKLLNHSDVYSFTFWQHHPQSPLAIRYYLPLMEALRNGDMTNTNQLLRLIIDESSSKTVQWLSTLEDDKGNTFAHYAAMNSSKNNARSMLRLLCKFGAHLNSTNKDNITPLDIVAQHGDVKWIREIIEMGGASYINPQALMALNDKTVMEWLQKYKDAVKNKGCKTTSADASDALHNTQQTHAPHNFLKRSKISKRKTSKGKKKIKRANATNTQHLDEASECNDSVMDNDAALKQENASDIMSKIKKKIQMESKKKKRIVHIASLSTHFIEQSKLKKLTRPQTTALTKRTKDNKETERPTTVNALMAVPKVVSPRNQSVNVFKVMANVTKFKRNLKEKLSDNQHAKLLSKMPIQHQNRWTFNKKKNKKNKKKIWTMKKLRKRLFLIKGKLPYLQKYKTSQIIDYTKQKRLQYEMIETLRKIIDENRKSKKKKRIKCLNVLSKNDIQRLAEIFDKIDVNGNHMIYLVEISAYYQLLTISSDVYNASHAMDDCKILFELMKLSPDKDGISLNMWLNVWNLVTLNFGQSFVNGMVSEYNSFKNHIQAFKSDSEEPEAQTNIKNNAFGQTSSKEQKRNEHERNDLCMSFL
eukprot:790906_1